MSASPETRRLAEDIFVRVLILILDKRSDNIQKVSIEEEDVQKIAKSCIESAKIFEAELQKP
jgi:hypothetical protein